MAAPPKRLLDNTVKLGFGYAVGTGTVGNVVIYTHGKGIGLLENHSHIFAKLVYIERKNILVLIFDLAGHLNPGDKIVHTV